MKKLSVVCWFLVALVNVPAHAAKLRPETAAAFDRYIRATEARMDDDVRHNKFLIVDGLPELHGYMWRLRSRHTQSITRMVIGITDRPASNLG